MTENGEAVIDSATIAILTRRMNEEGKSFILHQLVGIAREAEQAHHPAPGVPKQATEAYLALAHIDSPLAQVRLMQAYETAGHRDPHFRRRVLREIERVAQKKPSGSQ